MFRHLKYLAAAIPLMAASFALGDIASSKHDFSAATWSDQQICKPCHTPHNAIQQGITGRLWAHTLSTQTYKYHGLATKPLDQITTTDDASGTAAQTDMDSATRLCLSCHDGTVALDSFMGKDGTPDGQMMGSDAQHGSADANLGTDLSNDHPVGYKAHIDETNASVTAGVTHYRYKSIASIKAKLKLAVSPDAFPSGKTDQTGAAITYTTYYSVSCMTCHDVHNAGASGKPGLLRISNDNSDLCLTCHNK